MGATWGLSGGDAVKLHVLGVAPFRITPYRYQQFIARKLPQESEARAEAYGSGDLARMSFSHTALS